MTSSHPLRPLRRKENDERPLPFGKRSGRRLRLRLRGQAGLSRRRPLRLAGLWLAAFMAAASPSSAFFRIGPLAKEKPEVFRVTLRPWFTKGRAETKDSYLYLYLDGTKGEDGETVEFEDNRNVMFVLSTEIRPVRWLSLDLEYGNSSSSRGTGYYHYWVDFPNSNVLWVGTGITWNRPDHRDIYLWRATMRTQTSLWGANMYFRALTWRSTGKDESLALEQNTDVFGGYFSYDERFRMSDGFFMFFEPVALNPPPTGPFDGLSSWYHMHYEGFRVGLREEVVLPYRFRLLGKFSWMPTMHFRGEGVWNRNTGLLLTETNFKQKANDGQGFEFEATASHSPVKFLTLELGYRWLFLRAGRGDALQRLSNGTEQYWNLGRAAVDRHGWFGGLSFHY